MYEFELNSKIELITEDDELFEGLIHDIIDDKLYVSMVVDDKSFKLLHVNDSIKGVIFNGNRGISFEATVTNRISGNFVIYELSYPRNFIEVQRRNDVRVECLIPIKYSTEDDADNFEVGNILDLSAGGLKLSCEKSLNKNQSLLLEFKLDDDLFLLKGKALHKSISISPKQTLYTYGVKFIDITEKQQDIIIKHLFVLMRKNRLNQKR